MRYPILNIRSLLTALFSTAFVFALTLTLVQNTTAQRRFDLKAAGTETEFKALASFTQDLLNFIKQAQYIEQENNAPETEHKKLLDLGRRIKDGSGNYRSNLQGLISKLKSGNRWNDEFDAEFLNSITNAGVKSFIQKLGGARKALSAAEAAINSVGQDVDTTINEAKKPRAENFNDESIFVNASFSSRRGGKVRLKCVLLGVGVAAAEAARMKLTAENLDNLFDSNKCGGGGGAATTE